MPHMADAANASHESQPNLAALEPGCCAQVYGAVTMNNTMCLGLFLLVMHIRMLPWTYSSEVITTVGAFCPIASVFHVYKTHSNSTLYRIA